MPLKLIPPRKSPNWSIRGTYLGVYVDRSSGTNRRAVAARIMRDIEERIERGEFPEKSQAGGPTFLSAALAYLKARPQKRAKARNIGRLIQRFGETPLDEMTQDAIDQAAIEMYPNVTPATRNAYVYMPVSAILRLAGHKEPIKRPKGALGRVVTDYLNTDDAFAIIEAAEGFDTEFALLLRFLLFTGVRVGEALALRPEDIQIDRQRAWVRTSKNGRPRTLRLRGDLCEALASHKPTGDTFFRFAYGGHFHHKLMRAKLTTLGIKCPSRRPDGWEEPANRLEFVNFHTFCHTWATWMRQYGGVDIKGLVATGRWSSERAASRYTHAVARDEWDRVEALPDGKSVESKQRA